jgi:hypothetical protein
VTDHVACISSQKSDNLSDEHVPEHPRMHRQSMAHGKHEWKTSYQFCISFPHPNESDQTVEDARQDQSPSPTVIDKEHEKSLPHFCKVQTHQIP